MSHAIAPVTASLPGRLGRDLLAGRCLAAGVDLLPLGL